jgi:PAS domain-containing protein
MPIFTEALVDITALYLDPNNYRFQNAPDFVFASEKRFTEESVQRKTFDRLKDEALLNLKLSIIKNGFLPFERLVVAPVDADRYIVVEGNRRVAALRWISDDIAAGAEIPASVEAALHAIPVVIFPDDAADPGLREALMGIRHVSGIRAWGGFQRAQLVAKLKDTHGLDSSEVAQRLGMSVQEVNRRYRALNALKQMMDSEDFGEFAKPEMYAMFHEAVSLPSVREWLSWNEATGTFENTQTLEEFYSLLTPRRSDNDDEPAREAKISSYSEVRDLREILENQEAMKVLTNPSRSFSEALAITKRQGLIDSWKTEVSEAIEAIMGIGSFELKRLPAADLELLVKLSTTVNEVIADANKLRPADQQA